MDRDEPLEESESGSTETSTEPTDSTGSDRVVIEPVPRLPATRTGELERPALGVPAPGAPAGRAPANRRVWVALAALLLAVGFVILLLPRLVGDGDGPSDTEEAAGQEAAAGAAGGGATASAAGPAEGSPAAGASDPEAEVLRTAAREVLAQVHAIRARLEPHAPLWAAEEFAAASARATEGEEAFLAGEYVTSTERLGEALAELEAIEARTSDAFQQAVADGHAALDAEEVARAVDRFELALEIDPEDEGAQHGLSRAENLEEVLSLVRSGRDHERTGEVEAARDAYARAVELDGEWQPAREGLARADERLAEMRFEQNMSLGLQALAAGDLEAARARFEAAREVRPGAREPVDGLAQVAQEERLRAIAVHRRNAERYEGAEEWRAAQAEYAAALKLDGNVAFAREGLARTRQRAEMTERARALIAKPEQLFDPAVHADAVALVESSKRLPNVGPRMQKDMSRLGELTRLAATPIRVVLESDTLTQVSISRVGDLGSFARREISLRPGRYVVMGTRRGFRDVRHTLELIPGQKPPPVVVRCVESI